jgi:hypothetical protein
MCKDFVPNFDDKKLAVTSPRLTVSHFLLHQGITWPTSPRLSPHTQLSEDKTEWLSIEVTRQNRRRCRTLHWGGISKMAEALETVRVMVAINSMVWVRERTIPTERPPLVGEVIANFCGWRVPRGQRDGSPRPYSRFSRQEPLLFYQVAPQLYSRGWVDPVPDPLIFFCSAWESNPGPLDL